MSESQEDVLHKLDALLKKHTPAEQDIPVLTDLVEQPRVDLNSIPVLTEEIQLDLSPEYPYESAAITSEANLHPLPQHEDAPMPISDIAAAAALVEHNEVLARLEEVEHEVEAEIKARIAQVQQAPNPAQESNMEAPDTVAPPLPTAINDTHIEPPTLPVHAVFDEKLPEEMLREITARLEADVARIVQNNVQQTLADTLPNLLNSAMDKALSSLIEQFMVHMEEVVRQTIADELKKQLAPFKRPTAGHKS